MMKSRNPTRCLKMQLILYTPGSTELTILDIGHIHTYVYIFFLRMEKESNNLSVNGSFGLKTSYDILSYATISYPSRVLFFSECLVCYIKNNMHVHKNTLDV